MRLSSSSVLGEAIVKLLRTNCLCGIAAVLGLRLSALKGKRSMLSSQMSGKWVGENWITVMNRYQWIAGGLVVIILAAYLTRRAVMRHLEKRMDEAS